VPHPFHGFIVERVGEYNSALALLVYPIQKLWVPHPFHGLIVERVGEYNSAPALLVYPIQKLWVPHPFHGLIVERVGEYNLTPAFLNQLINRGCPILSTASSWKGWESTTSHQRFSISS